MPEKILGHPKEQYRGKGYRWNIVSTYRTAPFLCSRLLVNTLLEKQSKFPRYTVAWKVEENLKLQEIFRVVSGFPRYISCYIAESQLPLWQCSIIGKMGGGDIVSTNRTTAGFTVFYWLVVSSERLRGEVWVVITRLAQGLILTILHHNLAVLELSWKINFRLSCLCNSKKVKLLFVFSGLWEMFQCAVYGRRPFGACNGCLAENEAMRPCIMMQFLCKICKQKQDKSIWCKQTECAGCLEFWRLTIIFWALLKGYTIHKK